MVNRRSLIAVSFVVPLLAGRGVFAQGQAITGIGTTTNYTVDARITAVDPSARTVTLTSSDGTVATVKVSPAVANFSSTKVGDLVSVALEEKRTFVLSGPNTKVPGDSTTQAMAVMSTGNAAVGMSTSKSVTNWWVTSADPAAGNISLVDPSGGPVRTFKVANSEARADLSRVKPGDSLTSISSDIVAVAITPRT